MAIFTLNFIVAILAAVIGLITLLLVSSQVPGESLTAIKNINSPAFFPILSACLVILCSIVLGLKSILSGQSPDHKRTKLLTDHPWRQILIMVFFVLYTLVINLLGMMTAGFLMIIGLSYFLGYRKLKVILAVAIFVPVMVYVLFERLLLVILPHGGLF
jgi:hypothetical protein